MPRTWTKIDYTRRTVGDCATLNCHRVPEWHLEAGGVGSDYCAGCYQKIETALTKRASAKHKS